MKKLTIDERDLIVGMMRVMVEDGRTDTQEFSPEDILSLLTPPDGWKLVSREPNEEQHAVLTSLSKTLISDPHERTNYTVFAVKAWRLMFDAFHSTEES